MSAREQATQFCKEASSFHLKKEKATSLFCYINFSACCQRNSWL